MAKTTLLEEVPAALRGPLDGYQTIIPGSLPAFLAGTVEDIDGALGYIAGALDHQERVHDEDSKVFKGTITKVEFLERKSGTFVLGKKAVIHFEADGRGGKTEQQTINTDWVEYNGFDPHLQSFWIALSNTIVRIAEENIGTECLIRKAFKEAETSQGGDRVRYAANIVPIDGGGSSKSTSGRRKKDDDEDDRPRGRRGRPKVTAVSRQDIEDIIDGDKDARRAMVDLSKKEAEAILSALEKVANLNDPDERFDAFLDELGVDRVTGKIRDALNDALELKGDDLILDLVDVAIDILD